MRKSCQEWMDGLADLAEGRESPETQSHVANCSDCAKALDQLRMVLTAARTPYEQAPAALIASVKHLMPERALHRAKLKSSTLGLSGARSAGEDFQAVFDAGESSVRVMYSKEGDGWEVIGKLDSGACVLEVNDEEISSDEDGRFSFAVRELRESGFVLRISEAGSILVPSGQELLDNGPR